MIEENTCLADRLGTGPDFSAKKKRKTMLSSLHVECKQPLLLPSSALKKSISLSFVRALALLDKHCLRIPYTQRTKVESFMSEL